MKIVLASVYFIFYLLIFIQIRDYVICHTAFIFGIQSAKRLNIAVSVIIIGILSVFLGFLFWVSSPIMAITVMLIWGLMYGGVSVVLMTWIMTAVPKGIELGSSAYIAIFNLAIALGAYLGGLGVDNYGLNSVLLIAVLFIASALLCVFSSRYAKCSAK